MTGKTKKRDGSSFVETIVAVALLATFMGGAGRVIMSQRQVSGKARMHYISINIAKNQIEEIRNMRELDYSQILSMVEDKVRINKNGNTDPDGRYRRTTKVSFLTQYRIEIAVLVEIIDPVTLQFKGEGEYISSFIARVNKVT